MMQPETGLAMQSSGHSFASAFNPLYNIMTSKRLLLSLSAIALTCSMHAQVQLGVKGGFSYDIFTNKDNDPAKGTGTEIGGYCRVPISELLSFQPEVMYATRQAKATIDEQYSYQDMNGWHLSTHKGNMENRLSYVEVPLLLGIQVARGFRIHVGPVPALRVGYKSSLDYTITTSGNGATQQTQIKGDSNDAKGIRDFDFSAALGLNYELEKGFNFGVRYLRSFTTLGTNGGAYYNGIQVTIGYTFGNH